MLPTSIATTEVLISIYYNPFQSLHDLRLPDAFACTWLWTLILGDRRGVFFKMEVALGGRGILLVFRIWIIFKSCPYTDKNTLLGICLVSVLNWICQSAWYLNTIPLVFFLVNVGIPKSFKKSDVDMIFRKKLTIQAAIVATYVIQDGITWHPFRPSSPFSRFRSCICDGWLDTDDCCWAVEMVMWVSWWKLVEGYRGRWDVVAPVVVVVVDDDDDDW